jgi:hypothetical protein
LIYLDPHFIQAKSSASVDEYQTDPDQFHYGQARLIDMADLDPSLSFGYLINTYDDYLELIETVQEINKNISEEFKVLTVQNQGVEERILNDLNKRGAENL